MITSGRTSEISQSELMDNALRGNLLQSTESDFSKRQIISSDDMVIDTWSRRFAIGSWESSTDDKKDKKHKSKKKHKKKKHKKMTDQTFEEQFFDRHRRREKKE